MITLLLYHTIFFIKKNKKLSLSSFNTQKKKKEKEKSGMMKA
jgi:hypothetical protein